MNKIIIAVVVIVIVLGGGYFLISGKSAQAPTSQSSEPTPTIAAMQENASPSGAMEEQKVSLTESGFSPATITIKAGTKVTWTNTSGEAGNVSSDPHPTHTDYPPLNLGTFDNGQSVSLTFDKPGTYGYHDHLNPSLKATVIVQ